MNATALKDADGLIRDMLTACDIDHDGQITYDEFVKFCSQTEKELWTLFQNIDRDHSGNLDKTELSAAFERSGVAVSNARLDRFFGYIDKNHDGKIDFPEWRGMLYMLGRKGIQQLTSLTRLPPLHPNTLARPQANLLILHDRRQADS